MDPSSAVVCVSWETSRLNPLHSIRRASIPNPDSSATSDRREAAALERPVVAVPSLVRSCCPGAACGGGLQSATQAGPLSSAPDRHGAASTEPSCGRGDVAQPAVLLPSLAPSVPDTPLRSHLPLGNRRTVVAGYRDLYIIQFEGIVLTWGATHGRGSLQRATVDV